MQGKAADPYVAKEDIDRQIDTQIAYLKTAAELHFH